MTVDEIYSKITLRSPIYGNIKPLIPQEFMIRQMKDNIEHFVKHPFPVKDLMNDLYMKGTGRTTRLIMEILSFVSTNKKGKMIFVDASSSFITQCIIDQVFYYSLQLSLDTTGTFIQPYSPFIYQKRANKLFSDHSIVKF